MKKITRVAEFIYKFPHLPTVIKKTYRSFQLRRMNTEQIFTNIYANNLWKGKNSVSGPGSEIDQTGTVIQSLSGIIREYDFSTMLDVPCGDFHWMKEVDLGDIDYVGADIVTALLEENARRYSGDQIRFQKCDLISDQIPCFDLIFCRDCLVHFSSQDIFSALKNICDSHSGFLLTTTFPDQLVNQEIRTGRWRALNLEREPFCFPPPLKIINERCTEENGTYKHKSLGLWSIADLKKHLDAGVRNLCQVPQTRRPRGISLSSCEMFSGGDHESPI